jgi:beta-glucosidase
LAAFQDSESADSVIVYDATGEFAGQLGGAGQPQKADVGVVVVAEEPYAEGKGDRESLHLPEADKALIARMRSKVNKLVVVLFSGRPMIITEELELADAFIAAFWPGTEGAGMADAIFGEVPFSGKLSFTWPRSMDQIPLGSGGDPLFPFGFGLTTQAN